MHAFCIISSLCFVVFFVKKFLENLFEKGISQIRDTGIFLFTRFSPRKILVFSNFVFVSQLTRIVLKIVIWITYDPFGRTQKVAKTIVVTAQASEQGNFHERIRSMYPNEEVNIIVKPPENKTEKTEKRKKDSPTPVNPPKKRTRRNEFLSRKDQNWWWSKNFKEKKKKIGLRVSKRCRRVQR